MAHEQIDYIATIITDKTVHCNNDACCNGDYGTNHHSCECASLEIAKSFIKDMLSNTIVRYTITKIITIEEKIEDAEFDTSMKELMRIHNDKQHELVLAKKKNHREAQYLLYITLKTQFEEGDAYGKEI